MDYVNGLAAAKTRGKGETAPSKTNHERHWKEALRLLNLYRPLAKMMWPKKEAVLLRRPLYNFN
jgi:hypothetical protein